MIDGAMGLAGVAPRNPSLGSWGRTSIEDVHQPHVVCPTTTAANRLHQHDQRTLQNSMTNQRAKSPKAATPASWKPGQSGNPAGRPRTGLAFAERVRERVDPDTVITLALEVLADDNIPARERLVALWPLIDRGFIKPPTTSDINVNGGGVPQRDFASMSIDERRDLLAKLRAVPALDVGRPVDATTPTTTNPEQEQQPADTSNALPKGSPDAEG